MLKKILTIGISAALIGLFAVGLGTWTSDGQAIKQAEAGLQSFLAGDDCDRTAMRNMFFSRLKDFLVLREELNITETQREQFKTLIKENRAELAPVILGVMDKKQALHQAVFAEMPDDAAIRQAAEELGRSLGDAAVAASGVLQEARLILTQEQVTRLQEFRDSRKGHMSGLRKWLSEAPADK